MKCESCGSAEAGCEFEVTSKDGSAMPWTTRLCWDCLEKRMASIDEKERRNEMTTTPEGRVSAALRQAVINCGGEIRKVQWQGRVGAPDWLVMLCGSALFVEAKAHDGVPRRSQMVEFSRISRASGIPVLVIDRAEDAMGVINALLSRAEGNREAYRSLVEKYSFERFLRVPGCG